MKNMNRRILSLAMALLMVGVLLAGCSSGGNSSDTSNNASQSSGENTDQGGSGSGGEVRREVVSIGVTAEPNTYFPYAATSTSADYVYDFLYDRLVYTDYDGNFSPRLADSWESNEDGTVITFYLNHNVKWHDGEPFTAQDMVFAAQVATSPETTVTRRSYFASLVGTDDTGVCENMDELGVVAVDDYTLEYHFKTGVAISTFLYVDAQRYYPMPYHLLKDVPFSEMETNEYWQHPIGTGSFCFESATAGERVNLTVNPDYFLGMANMDKVVFRVMNSSSLAAALLSGDLDMSISDVPMADMALLQGQENLVADPLPSFKYTYMTINCAKEYFQDTRIRQAFNMAIDRQEIVDQGLYGYGAIATSSLNEDNPYYNDAISGDPYDPEGARALLEEAGWDFDRELLLMVPTGNKVREYSGAMIQNDLQAIGMKVSIQYSDLTSIIAMLGNDECDLALIGSSGSVDPDESRPHYEIGGGQNWGGITDPKYSELAVKGKSLTTFEERKAVYDEYQKVIAEECPIIYLYSTNSLVACRDFFDYVPMIDFALQNHKVHAWTFTE